MSAGDGPLLERPSRSSLVGAPAAPLHPAVCRVREVIAAMMSAMCRHDGIKPRMYTILPRVKN